MRRHTNPIRDGKVAARDAVLILKYYRRIPNRRSAVLKARPAIQRK